jgi:DNA-binding response OmpR family regulator
MAERLVGTREHPAQLRDRPALGVATTNGQLLRFVQSLAHNQGWGFNAFLSGDQALEAASSDPPDLLLIDVFLDNQTGFDLRGTIRAHPGAEMAPILLIAPGCDSGEELAERLGMSLTRFEADRLDEAGVIERIRAILGDVDDSRNERTRFRYATFLQVAGEACHAANQPLTSLICNLELAMHQVSDDTMRGRLKAGHDSAVRLMNTIQQLQRLKWREEKDYVLPIYLLPGRAGQAVAPPPEASAEAPRISPTDNRNVARGVL